MNWNSWTEFFHMGGYALYVWGAYGVTAALIAAEIIVLRQHHRRALQQAQQAVKFGNLQEPNHEA